MTHCQKKEGRRMAKGAAKSYLTLKSLRRPVFSFKYLSRSANAPSGRTDGGYAITQNCNVLNFMPLVVYSPDFSIDQNQISGSLR
jgi:hypothetical protein